MSNATIVSRRSRAVRARGFTLVELLVVIAIIGILIAIVIPVIGHALERGRQAGCMSNLRQFGTLLLTYRTDRYTDPLPVPGWLSNLYGSYADAPPIYICPSDRSGGRDGSKPLAGDATVMGDLYPETNDTEFHPSGPTAYGRNPLITRCSYLYEFNAAPCSWNWRGFLNATEADVKIATAYPHVSWGEAKYYQMRFGDTDNNHRPYGEDRIPIVSCYHHYARSRIEDRDGARVPLTLRVAYAGNVFVAPVKWETAR